MEIIDAANGMIVKANNDVSSEQASLSCRAVAFERDDKDSAFHGKVIVAYDAAGQRNGPQETASLWMSPHRA